MTTYAFYAIVKLLGALKLIKEAMQC